MREKRNWFKTLLQRLYITWDAFIANDLFTHASAGAYSFILSIFPVLLMVLVVLILVVHTAPEVITSLFGTTELFGGSFDLAPFIASITSIKTIGIFEIILGASIFWMARRFFASLQQGMKRIYRKRGKVKPVKENLIVLAGEALLVVLIVSLAIFLTAGNAYFDSVIPKSVMTPMLYAVLNNLFTFAPYGMLFLFLTLVYYFTPRTKPSAAQSALASLACSASFFVVLFVFATFVNMTKYNLVYGIMSNLIVVLLEVYLFFFLFLFFAQYQYVAQYFDSYLLAQLYLLPAYGDPNPFNQLKRMLFIEPVNFYRDYAIVKRPGEILFRLGDDTTELYYVWQGTIRLDMHDQIIETGRGRVFGEFSSIAGGLRTATAMAMTDAILLKLPAALFQETIEVDAELSRRTLQLISDYVRKKNKVPLSTDE
jgi:membrane protein